MGPRGRMGRFMAPATCAMFIIEAVWIVGLENKKYPGVVVTGRLLLKFRLFNA